MDLLERELPVEASDATGRTVTVRLCRWSTPTDVVERDGTRYREQYPPGSLELANDVHVVDRHDGDLIGRADPSTLRDTDDGPVVDLRIAHTTRGNELLALVADDVIRAVSMELQPVTETRARDGLITRTRSIVHGIAFAFRPQHDAPILALRAQPGEPNMTTIDTPTLPLDGDGTPPPAPPALPANLVDVATLDRAIEDVRRDLLTRDAPTVTGHPAGLYRSLDEWATAAWNGELDPNGRRLLTRALVDQITTNNPGVIPPGWVSTVYGIVDHGRPAITAFGSEALPDAGMDINWPYFAGDLYALIGAQTTQKTAITSVAVNLAKGTEPIATFAGGSDISYQLIRRSSPSYREAYLRIMFAAYAAVTDKVAAEQAWAEATGTGTLDLATADADDVRAALFAASADVQAATGSPASFVLAATDAFGTIGALPGLYPSVYGTNNVAGTSDAGSLQVNVSGLRVIHVPGLTAGRVLVSNGQAASWMEDGPMTVAAEDVEKLGVNVAVWGMGAFAAFVPAGIVKLAAA